MGIAVSVGPCSLLPDLSCPDRRTRTVPLGAVVLSARDGGSAVESSCDIAAERSPPSRTSVPRSARRSDLAEDSLRRIAAGIAGRGHNFGEIRRAPGPNAPALHTLTGHAPLDYRICDRIGRERLES